MKAVIKEIAKLVKNGEKEKAKEKLSEAHKRIDKAAKRGVIKKNTAARKKSRLTKAVS